MATSQGWDANLLSHSLEFDHKTVFSLAFVFNLDMYSNVWMFIQSLSRVIFPFRLHPFAQQASLPFLREELASPVSSHTHDLLLDIQQRVSLPPFKPARPDCLTGSCMIIEKSLGILDHISPEVHFGLVGRVKGTARGTGTGRCRPRCLEHALLVLQEGSVRFKNLCLSEISCSDKS